MYNIPSLINVVDNLKIGKAIKNFTKIFAMEWCLRGYRQRGSLLLSNLKPLFLLNAH